MISFFLTLVVFTFVLFMGNIIRIVDLIVKHIDPILILKYFLYAFPYLLTYTIPMSLLTAVILIFGKMSADNEITAMRSSGIGMWRIFVPGIALGILLSFLCLLLNDKVYAVFHYGQRQLRENFQVSDPEAFLIPGHNTNEFQGYKINIGRKKGGVLYDVTINEFLENGSKRFIRANRGNVLSDEQTKEVMLKLTDGIIEEPDTADPTKFFQGQFGVYTIKFPGSNPNAKTLAKKHRDLTIEELQLERGVLQKRIPNSGPLEKKELKKEISVITTAIHERLSYSFACLAFVMIGMPFGVKAHRSEKTIGAAISLGLVAAHYLFVMLGKALSDRPEFYPHWVLWSPNLVLMLLGIWMIYKIQRR